MIVHNNIVLFSSKISLKLELLNKDYVQTSKFRFVEFADSSMKLRELEKRKDQTKNTQTYIRVGFLNLFAGGRKLLPITISVEVSPL